MKTFNVPTAYRSTLIGTIKQRRRAEDRLKKNLQPTKIDFGPLQVFLARHFGFCYGVENAIEIAFRTIEENPGKRIFLLSEMIHNPMVNADLLSRGVRFLQDTAGRTLIPFSDLQAEDIVLIPAFGTTLDIARQLEQRGISIERYNTTCPFVEKVWNRSAQIASKGYSIVIHGKPRHEETRATFSHAASVAPAIIIRDMEEAVALAGFIRGEEDPDRFYERFAGRISQSFNVRKDLQRIGVVNQTTQLATDTQAISDYLKQVMIEHYGLTAETLADHFADTRDTLCYATNDNQSAMEALLQVPADLALIAGGYNSSNTTHLVEMCADILPAYFIRSAEEIISAERIRHFDIVTKKTVETGDYLPTHRPVRILLSSGASCPDAVVEGILDRLLELFGAEIPAGVSAEPAMTW